MSTSAMDVDETDQANGGTNQTQSMTHANETFLATLPEPWKTIASEAIPSSSSSTNKTTPSIRMEQMEMSSRSHFLQLLLKEDDDDKAHKIGSTWRTALDMCHHIVHFAKLHKEKQQKEIEEKKKEAEANEEEEGKEEANAEETESSYSSPYLGMEPRKLPLILLEDCIDGLTLKESQSLWMDHVEPSLSPILLGDLFWKSSKVCHLQFLKVCNQLLHRIQGSSAHYEWKGSILLAQAKAFDIADRSAIKVWGSFRGSTREIDEEGDEDFESFDEFVDKTEEPQGEKEYSLYKAFWSLQSDFSNPNSIQIADFIKKMKLVLEAMESVSQNNNNSTTKSDSINPLSTSESYLTSSNLFLTQLEQTEFQSQFLSQFIIVTNHLSSESPSLGNALSTLDQRSKELLKKASPAVHHLLCDVLLVQSEAHWRKWKKEQRCAASAFATSKRLMETVGVLENGEWDEHTKKGAQLIKEAMKGMPRKSAANKQMARQKKQTEDDEWIQKFAPVSKEEVMVACVKLGSFEPSLDEHMEEFIDAFDPDAGIEEEYHPKNDPGFSWRAMRLFAKHQLGLLKLCRKPKHLETMARQWYKDKNGKDLPGEMPESEASESEDEEDKKRETQGIADDDEKNEREDEDEIEEAEDGSEGDGEDADADVDADADADAVRRSKSRSEDVEMGDNGDAKAESSDDAEDGATKDAPMEDEKEEERPKDSEEGQDVKKSEVAEETSEPEEAADTAKTEGDEEGAMEEAEDSQVTTTTEATEGMEDASKKEGQEEKERDPKDVAHKTDVTEDEETTTNEEAKIPIKKEDDEQDNQDDAKNRKEEATVKGKEERGTTEDKETSEDKRSQNGSRKESSENGEMGNNRSDQNDSSNSNSNSNKRKHPDKESIEKEDASKRPRDDGSGGRRSRTTSEERQAGPRDNNDRGGGGRDRFRNDNRGGSRRGRSDDGNRRGGSYDRQDDHRRRDSRDHEGGRGSDGGRYEDGPKGGRQGGDRFNDGPRGRRSGDHKEDEPRDGTGRRDDRFDSNNNAQPPRGGGRRDDRDDDGHRRGRGGGARGGSRNSGGGDRRFERRPDDRSRGSRRGGGGGGGRGRGGGGRR